MPPQQCPECGRFLKKAFVESLAESPTPCPGCGSELTAVLFEAGTPVAQGASTAVGETAPQATSVAQAASTNGDDGSVRPPDLSPTAVRDGPSDVLEGWDRGQGPPPVIDRAPFPTDAAVVAGAALFGAALGGALDDRRLRGATLGVLGGVLAGAVSRRVWRLE